MLIQCVRQPILSKKYFSFLTKHFSCHQSGNLFRKKKEDRIMKVQGKIKSDMICIVLPFSRRKNRQEFLFFPKLEVDELIQQIMQ